MNSVGTDHNISCVSRAVFGLNVGTILNSIHADNTFTRQDSVFRVKVVKKSLKEHLSIDKDLRIPRSVTTRSEKFRLEEALPKSK